jgi:hypothetical protein
MYAANKKTAASTLLRERIFSKHPEDPSKQGRELHAIGSGKQDSSSVQDEKDHQALLGKPPQGNAGSSWRKPSGGSRDQAQRQH